MSQATWALVMGFQASPFFSLVSVSSCQMRCANACPTAFVTVVKLQRDKVSAFPEHV